MTHDQAEQLILLTMTIKNLLFVAVVGGSCMMFFCSILIATHRKP